LEMSCPINSGSVAIVSRQTAVQGSKFNVSRTAAFVFRDRVSFLFSAFMNSTQVFNTLVNFDGIFQSCAIVRLCKEC
jgi:hypothetical protein